MKCLYCEKEFEILPNGKSGGNNRQFCYDCLPEGASQCSSEYQSKLLRQKIMIEKEQRGCDICGYNKNGAALDWHHFNDDKEYNPSQLINNVNWESLNKYRKETSKCMLLCSNCHREIHNPKIELIKPVGSNDGENFRNLVKEKYLKDKKSINQISKDLGKSPETISKVLKFFNIEIRETAKPILMLDKNNKSVIMEFSSLTDASNFLGKGKGGIIHIADVCKDKRKSAYGYY